MISPGSYEMKQQVVESIRVNPVKVSVHLSELDGADIHGLQFMTGWHIKQKS